MTNPYYLFSVDLEDIRFRMSDGLQYSPRTVKMTEKYLAFLKKHQLHATFFTVGDVARAEPDLIRRILAEGHEIAAHSDQHLTLDQQTPQAFAEDLERNLESLQKAGAEKVIGYRAPVFSLTPKTQWAYEILEKYGITYSSSVLPSKNPLHGWPDFGEAPRRIGSLVEIPMSLFPVSCVAVPFGGGVYFRVLPRLMLKYALNVFWRRKADVIAYFHPYDIDTEQEDFMHPGIDNSKLYNFLLRFNRSAVIPRLERLLQQGWQVVPYREYLKILNV